MDEQQTTADILKVSDATGKNGPQWELKVKWPWHPAGNKYGDSVWLDVSDFPEKPTTGTHSVVVIKGPVKKKQDGGYHDGSKDWMYNFNILSFGGKATQPEKELFGDPRDQEPQGRAERPIAGIEVEGVVQGHLEKLAVDLYIAEGADTSHANGLPDYLRIREIRDGFFHNVKEHSIMPQHHCYPHDVGRNRDNHDRWYHKVGEHWCVEGAGVLDSDGNPVEQEE